MDEADQAMFDADADTLFDRLFEMKNKGEVTLEEIKGFFPKDITDNGG